MRDPYKEWEEKLGDLQAFRDDVARRRQIGAQMVQKQQAEEQEHRAIVETFRKSKKGPSDVARFHSDIAAATARHRAEKKPLLDTLLEIEASQRSRSQERGRRRS